MIKQSFKIEDNGLIERMKQAPEIYEQETRNFLETVLAYIHRLVVNFTPHSFGHLQKSIKVTEITGTPVSLQGKVTTISLYGEPVEHGTKPHWAPIKPLERWARRKFGESYPGEAKEIAYGIRANIKKWGTKGAHMFKKAFDMSKSFVQQQQEALAARITRRIDKG